MVVIILPIPTMGDTKLPDRNPAAPNTAEAVPMVCRPSFMASVVAEVKM